MYKSTKRFVPTGNNSMRIGRFSFPIPEVVREIQNVNKIPILKEVKNVEFSKLGVY